MDPGVEEGCRESFGDDAVRSFLGLAEFSDVDGEKGMYKLIVC